MESFVELLLLIYDPAHVVDVCELEVEEGILAGVELVDIFGGEAEFFVCEELVAGVLGFVLLHHHLMISLGDRRQFPVQLLHVLFGYLDAQLLQLLLPLVGVHLHLVLRSHRAFRVRNEPEANEKLHGPVLFVGLQGLVPRGQVPDDHLLQLLEVYLAALLGQPFEHFQHLSGLLNRVLLLEFLHPLLVIVHCRGDPSLRFELLSGGSALLRLDPGHSSHVLHLLLLVYGQKKLLLPFILRPFDRVRRLRQLSSRRVASACAQRIHLGHSRRDIGHRQRGTGRLLPWADPSCGGLLRTCGLGVNHGSHELHLLWSVELGHEFVCEDALSAAGAKVSADWVASEARPFRRPII